MQNFNYRNCDTKSGFSNQVTGFGQNSLHQNGTPQLRMPPTQTTLLQSQTSIDSSESQYSPVNFSPINGILPEPPQDYQEDRDCTKGKRGIRILALLIVLTVVIAGAIIVLSLLVSLKGSSVHSTRVVNITNTVYRGHQEPFTQEPNFLTGSV